MPKNLGMPKKMNDIHLRIRLPTRFDKLIIICIFGSPILRLQKFHHNIRQLARLRFQTINLPASYIEYTEVAYIFKVFNIFDTKPP